MKCLVARQWKSIYCPSLNMWIGELSSCLSMEKLTYTKEKKKKSHVFHNIWNSFLRFLESKPDPISPYIEHFLSKTISIDLLFDLLRFILHIFFLLLFFICLLWCNRYQEDVQYILFVFLVQLYFSCFNFQWIKVSLLDWWSGFRVGEGREVVC